MQISDKTNELFPRYSKTDIWIEMDEGEYHGVHWVNPLGFPFENFGGGGQDSPPPLGQVGGGGIYANFW